MWIVKWNFYPHTEILAVVFGTKSSESDKDSSVAHGHFDSANVCWCNFLHVSSSWKPLCSVFMRTLDLWDYNFWICHLNELWVKEVSLHISMNVDHLYSAIDVFSKESSENIYTLLEKYSRLCLEQRPSLSIIIWGKNLSHKSSFMEMFKVILETIWSRWLPFL